MFEWRYILIGFAVTALAIVALIPKAETDFDCRFQRMGGLYTVTDRELKRTSTLITVTHESRTFMFRREDVIGCFAEANDEDLD